MTDPTPALLEHFLTRIEAAMGDDAALAQVLVALHESVALRDTLHAALSAIAAGQRAPLRALGGSEMLLARNPSFTLHLTSLSSSVGTPTTARARALDYFQTPGRSQLWLARSSAPVRVRRYQPASRIEHASFVADVPLQLIEEREYDGAVLHAAAERAEILDLQAQAPIVVLKLAYGPVLPQTWFFDRSGMRSVFAAAVETDASMLVWLAKTFGAQRDPESLRYLEELSVHPAHYVRWPALQAIGRIDGARALDLLTHAAANDSHAHIRAAATKALLHYERHHG